ncbi:hypothetical protein [Streptosporangium sp. NPDC049644]|uniref:hypothetical protein n=1 Tax=Streptosporangium sp. NPDC049644 TaxID=3155507 RepID=UPI00344657EA
MAETRRGQGRGEAGHRDRRQHIAVVEVQRGDRGDEQEDGRRPRQQGRAPPPDGEAKDDFPWLAEVPGHCLQQALIDLDQACAKHGVWKVRWKSKVADPPGLRFPEGGKITVERLNRRWARVKLPELGWVRFRVTRPLGGKVKNATVSRDGEHWYKGCRMGRRHGAEGPQTPGGLRRQDRPYPGHGF